MDGNLIEGSGGGGDERAKHLQLDVVHEADN